MSDHRRPIANGAELRLETARLLLRPLDPVDARSMAHLLEGDSAAVRMTERLADPCDEVAARDWIARRRGPGEQTFAIELGGTFIGCIGLSIAGREAGLGYWLGRPYWKQGYATEAGRAIVNLAGHLEVELVVAETFLTNPASAAVLLKLGFAERGRIQKSLPERGGPRTLQRFELRFSRSDDGKADHAANER